MTPLAVIVDVGRADGPSGPAGHHRRVAGLLPGNSAIGVARVTAGDETGLCELSFEIGEAAALAEQVLAGDRRAITTPGLARILSATAAVLFRVAHAAGALDHQPAFEEPDGRGDPDDRGEAAGDEDPDE